MSSSTSFSSCKPYSQEACKLAAVRGGLSKGGNGYAFAGDYGTKGCYTYSSGSYRKIAFYGTGGSDDDRKKTSLPGSQIRPAGWDKCPHAASLASMLHGNSVDYEYQGAGCLNSPWKSGGSQTTENCAKLCENDSSCRTFSTSGSSCYTSSASGYKSCSWWSSDENIYKVIRGAELETAESVLMVSAAPVTSVDLAVYGFAAIGFAVLVHGSYKFYCSKAAQTVESTEFTEI